MDGNGYCCTVVRFQSTLPTRGSDQPLFLQVQLVAKFQSTLPTRGSDLFAFLGKLHRLYFNPRSPRGGATTSALAFMRPICISIHAPHEGERRRASAVPAIPKPFQSTLPTRGSDPTQTEFLLHVSNFNPRSPRGGATEKLDRAWGLIKISIHAPHEGERLARTYGRRHGGGHFNPRSPRGGATGTATA